mmetsp:Transcript_127426/g.271676  ORF Transcript_127426/g.271676 Transcript_127426/m.271676 type:complete len:202 (-) Transcript_127426:63-668(-)
MPAMVSSASRSSTSRWQHSRGNASGSCAARRPIRHRRCTGKGSTTPSSRMSFPWASCSLPWRARTIHGLPQRWALALDLSITARPAFLSCWRDEKCAVEAVSDLQRCSPTRLRNFSVASWSSSRGGEWGLASPASRAAGIGRLCGSSLGFGAKTPSPLASGAALVKALPWWRRARSARRWTRGELWQHHGQFMVHSGLDIL